MKDLSVNETAKKLNQNQQSLHVAMPFLNTPYKLGSAKEFINQIEDKDTRQIALAEYYYFSGLSAKASDIAEEYLTHQDIALRLSACWIYGYANMALDRITRAKQAIHQIQTTVASIDENTPLIYQAYGKCVGTGANVLLHLPLSENINTSNDYISILPKGLRLFALYIQAHQAYLDKQYGVCIGISETALIMESELYPIPTIYLHLVAAMGHMSMRQSEQAKDHLLKAWEIAQKDDMIEPFGEHHGLLGGLLEILLRKDYPDDFNRIINITYSFSAGWRKIHNPETGHNVADDLTTMEFTVAMLAARKWSNKEISAHLNISINTVKMHISSALQKLGISKRSELSQFMLK
ncbi:MAG: helix-turn-helix transcriptional regulator [Erysipelotrichaceae bacterium]|nr:helix-turn-helix transcriptional regulator [Erysipelotrichaceae bacterium]